MGGGAGDDLGRLPGGGADGARLKDKEKSLTQDEAEAGRGRISRPKRGEELRSLESSQAEEGDVRHQEAWLRGARRILQQSS